MFRNDPNKDVQRRVKLFLFWCSEFKVWWWGYFVDLTLIKSGVRLRKDHRHFRSRLHAIVLKHVWDQLFTVNTILNIGETGDINTILQ